ncbi:MAG: hypothetical protein K6G79_02225 [Bacteroidales bacterium]|nr:hypothetical protein [Bacteroidales bacterium]
MKWLHNLLKGMSLTAALFVFQACYGTPPGYPEDDFDPEKVSVVDQAPEASVEEAVLPEMEEPEAEPAEE